MSGLIKCFKDWRFWGAAGIVAVAAAAYLFLGKVAAMFLAAIAVLAVALGWGARWIAKRFRSRTAGELARGMLALPSPPLAEGRASIQDLTRGFHGALEKLRNAPELGPDYLYRVPWYLIIGEPASGKTTTIRYSNLDLIGDKQQGVGGTLNCDWWFTNHGIILDTAGRYVYSEEGAPDRKEWESFLTLLKRYRSRQPLNGVILVLPVVRTKGDVDLPLLLPPADASSDPELLDRCARAAEKLYEKVSQLPQKLGVRFPVYILVTKCDKVPGFQEFFTQSAMEYQTQLLGWSNPDVETPFSSGMIDKTFEGLERNLDRARMEILARETPLAFPDEVFVFPEEFRRMKEPLRRFLDVLFKKNIFQESLLFRGIYFTSGLQDRKPLDGLLGQATMGPAPAAAAQGPVGEVSMAFSRDAGPLFESKPFFIRDFYSEKVFPEAALVRPTRASYQRAKRLTSTLRGATLAIGVGGLVAFSVYLAAILDSSRNLAAKLEPLSTSLREFEPERWKKLEFVGEHSKVITDALDGAKKFDRPLLRWLSIDLPTARIRRTGFDGMETLVLRPLANRFLAEFPKRVRAALERPDLIRPAPTLAEAELASALIPAWKREADDYLRAVRGENISGSQRLLLLWRAAIGEKATLPPSLLTFSNSYGNAPEFAASLAALPGLETALPPLQERLLERLHDLDLAVLLPVEKAARALQEMARQTAVLSDAKASFPDRRAALENLIQALGELPKDLLAATPTARPIEEHFEKQLVERAKQMEDVVARSAPILEKPAAGGASGGLWDTIRSKVLEKGGKKEAAPAASGSWKEGERWKKLQAILEGKDLQMSGIGPGGGKTIALFRTGEVAGKEGEPAERKVLYALTGEALDFFREVEFVKNHKALWGDGAARAALPANADEEIREQSETLLSEGFLADERQIRLIQRVREVLSGEAPAAADAKPPADGPRPPVTPALLKVLKELVRLEVQAALFQEVVQGKPPPPEAPALPFGDPKEAAFLTRIESKEWLPAGDAQRDLVERIQMRHARNRLNMQRRTLSDRKIFQIVPDEVRQWDFAPQSEENNLKMLFGTSDSVLETYMAGQIRLLKVEFINNLAKSGCLPILDGRPLEDQGPDHGFWKQTLAENEEGNPARAQLRDLIKKVVALRSNDRIPFQSMTNFIDTELAVEAQHAAGKSFLDLRYVQIRDSVIARIRTYMAERFAEEFGRFAPKVHDAVRGKFPVYFDDAAVDPYKPLQEEFVRADEFFARWEISAGGEGKKTKLWEYIEKEFQKGAGVDLAAAYRDLIEFVKANFFQANYGVQLKILNRDNAFENTLGERDRMALKEANRLLREFLLQVGDTSQKLSPDVEAEATWTAHQAVSLKVRLTAAEDRYRIRRPQDKAAPSQEAVFDYEGGAKEPWALFRMLLKQRFRLGEEGNMLRFDFEVSPPVALAGGEISSIPLFIQVKIQRLAGAAGAKEQFRKFNYEQLSTLYGKIVEPKLQMVSQR